MTHSDHDRSLDFDAVEQRLRDERPTLTAMEIDGLRQRVARRAANGKASNPLSKGSLMKSRLALLLMIALGVLMSGTGATLAITGAAGSDSAAVSQYREGDGDDGGVLGDLAPSDEPADDQADAGDTAPSGDSSGPADVQEARQVSTQDAGSDSLPFTGFLVFPLLIGGVALVGTGALLRRRATDS